MKRKPKKRKEKDYPLEIKVENLINSFSINKFGNYEPPPICPLVYAVKKERFNSLSREARFIIGLIVWSPLDLFIITKKSTKMTIDDIDEIVTKTQARGSQIIKRFLRRRMKLPLSQAVSVIKEIAIYSKNI